jgi:hypothetical protein
MLHNAVDLVADVTAACVRGEDEIGVVVNLLELRTDIIYIEFHWLVLGSGIGFVDQGKRRR